MSEEVDRGRRDLLTDLVELRRPISDVVSRLRQYHWDVDRPIVFVGTVDVVRILEFYLSGEVSADTITEWADALEMREDVQVDERLFEFFMEASSPEIHEPISKIFARRWISLLK